MSADATRPLSGRTVLVTRPEHQAEPLCALISAAGGRPIRLPVTSIRPPDEAGAARRLLDRIDSFDAVIFVSRNAVSFAEQLAPGCLARLAARAAYAVGGATALELRWRGIACTAPDADGHGSEALLELDGLTTRALRGAQVLIVRGVGGRAFLGRELERRGARVAYAEVYRRAPAEPDAQTGRRIWRDARPDVIVTTSVQGIEQLVSMTDPESRERLLGTALVAISRRVAARAAELGFRAPIGVAAAANDAALMDAIRQIVGGAP